MTNTKTRPGPIAKRFERVTGQPMTGFDDNVRRSEAAFVERLLNRDDLTAAELRKRLDHVARCDNPGIHVDHIVETWQRMAEINPQTVEEQDEKLRLDFEVYKAACYLVTPAGAA